MKINIDCCFFVLENITSENKRKNDEKKFKLLVDKNSELLTVTFDGVSDIKELIKSKIKNVIGSDIFHLEQVYTLGDEKFNSNGISVIYLGITNMENIKKLDSNYKLIDFDIIQQKEILFDDKLIGYKTKVKKEKNSLEYFHEILSDDIKEQKKMIELITSYKQIVSKLDYTDIVFKFLPKYFSLEDVRIIYEKIKNVTVDKSNFRKKIMKNCKATDKVVSDKGYRPTQLYEFVLDEKDIWI